MSDEYSQAIEIAKANLADIRERGEDALVNWGDIARKYFTPEEIAQAEREADIMYERPLPMTVKPAIQPAL